MDSGVEISKSWFKLAQIFMMFSGFMFASSSFSYVNSMEGLNIGLVTLSETQETCLNNVTRINCDEMIELTKHLLELSNSQFSLWAIFINIGVLTALMSIVFWLFGYFNLWRLKNEKKK